MRILITGATGTIGQSVADVVRRRGDQVVAVSRDAGHALQVLGADAEIHTWPDPTAGPPPPEALRVDAIVHLIGEPIDQRWTDDAKRRIHDSRVLSTRNLVDGLLQLPDADRPGVLVSQSAVGFYGDRGETHLDESASAGNDWLAGVVVAWEAEALRASGSIRVATTRTGVVLSPTGGALAKMLPIFKLGIGGPVAGGKQYVPWIHLDDIVGALLHCVDTEAVRGAVNLSAPTPVTNATLSHTLGRVLRRPAFAPVPGLAVKLLYGEMAQLVTQGQRAVPVALEQSGYGFAYTEVGPALRNVLGS